MTDLLPPLIAQNLTSEKCAELMEEEEDLDKETSDATWEATMKLLFSGLLVIGTQVSLY